jgi:hypothetical protein
VAGVVRGPLRGDGVGQRIGFLELAAQRAVGADEIGIAETADGAGAVGLAAAPEVAAREAALCPASDYVR